MDWLNYHHLLYFWTVAEQGSVQRASEVLHVAPATVSIQVRQLERSLDAKLLKRQGRGVVLTDVGEEVRRYAEEIFSTGQELLQMVRGRPVGQPLLLRIGVKDAMPKLMAFQLLEPAMKLAQETRVVCREGDVVRLIGDLAVHKLDIVFSDSPLDPNLKIRAYSHLLSESEVVVMGQSRLARRLKKGFPQSLDGAPFLLPTENALLRRSLDTWFQQQGIRPTIVGEFEDSAMLKIAARSGAGVIATPVAIEAEVRTMYGVQPIGRVPELRERFYALTVDRRMSHPAIAAISDAAKRRIEGGS